MTAPTVVTGVVTACRACAGRSHITGTPTGITVLAGEWMAAHREPSITDVELTVGGVPCLWRLVGA